MPLETADVDTPSCELFLLMNPKNDMIEEAREIKPSLPNNVRAAVK